MLRHFSARYSPHLCVGFLFSVVHSLVLQSARRPLTHTQFSRTTLSHKILFHTFTHNFVGHNSVTRLCQHNSVTHNSFTQNSVTQLSHCFFSVSGMAPGKESIYMLKHSHWQEHFNRTKTSGTTHTTNLITCKQVCIQSMMLSMLSHHLVFPDIGFHKVPRC